MVIIVIVLRLIWINLMLQLRHLIKNLLLRKIRKKKVEGDLVRKINHFFRINKLILRN